jgi:RHS repeat-associated protein
LTETRTYDLQSRLLNISLGNTDQTGLSYDANSNILTRNTGTDSHSYQYDPLDRITSETNNGNAIDYQYDPNDNRLQKTESSQSTSYDITPDSNQLEAIDNQPLLYDVAGNLTQDAQGRQYQYNNAGRLEEIQLNGQILAQYRYNNNGQRSHKITPTETVIYHYDLNGNLVSETKGDGTPIRDYIWHQGNPVAQIDSNGTGETLTYLHNDHLNTPRLATNANQAVTWRWEGEAFGNTAPQSFGATINLRFPGQYFDFESGLLYNWNRYYDPSTGRYITRDLIGLLGGLNTYGYVSGNPLTHSDLFGLEAVDISSGVKVSKGKVSIDFKCLLLSKTCSISGTLDAKICKIKIKKVDGEFELNVEPNLSLFNFGPFSAGPKIDFNDLVNDLGNSVKNSDVADDVRTLTKKSEQGAKNDGAF